MGQVLHGGAATTVAVRRAIQHSQESLRLLAKRYGVNQKAVAKWKRRSPVADVPTGPKDARSTVLAIEEEAIVVAFGRHTLLPLDDCLYALQATIPHLTRPPLHRRLQRHGISQLPKIDGEASARRKFKDYPIGHFHIDIAEARTAQGRLHLFAAIDRTSKFAFVEPHEKDTHARRGGLPSPLHRRSSLQDPHGADRQRRALHRSSRRGMEPSGDQGTHGAGKAFPNARIRMRLRTVRHRPPACKASTPLDEWPGGADESHDQRGDGEALLLRNPR